MTENRIIRRLCDHGHKTYIIGGFVRDELLGHAPKDIDIVTSATPDEILELFRDRNCNKVGQTFAVVIVDGFDVATFRTEVYNVPGKPEVTTTRDIVEDLKRRDFTFNTLALCPRSGDILDLHGGREDLANRVVRFVGNPKRRIDQDPVRIIRACRFKAKIDGEFHPTTLKALRDNVHLLRKVDAERIRLEILQGLKIKKASRFIRALEEIGVLPFVFPSLQTTVGFEGGEFHGEDVFRHCTNVCDALHPKNPLLRLAGLLHDCGKPATWNGSQFLGHETVGARIATKELQRLRFSVDEVKFVTGLIEVHMNFMNNLTPRATRRLVKRLADHNVTLQDFIRIKVADRAGNEAKPNKPFADLIQSVRNIKSVFDIPTNTNSLVINGNDIQELLGIGPSRQIGVIKDALLELVIDNGPEFNNRETLINHILTVWG
jgi:putative nucleotidyltransferase with HDIG domain